MKFSRRSPLRMALGSALAALLGTAALPMAAQTADSSAYPSKPLRMIVPYPAGGGADIIGRAIAQQLGQAWNVPVIVENKPGASGITGNDLVAKSAPDGYTMLIGITAMIQTPALYAKLPYDVLKDFAPVSQIAMSSDLFVVPPRPMATPMSACLRAGASLTPSPVIATTLPRPCSARTRRSFCSGSTRAKTSTAWATSASAVRNWRRKSKLSR